MADTPESMILSEVALFRDLPAEPREMCCLIYFWAKSEPASGLEPLT